MNVVYSIGRNPTNNIVLAYPQISGKHAIITQITANTLLLEDLGSVNGTFVNGIQVARMVISPTDKIKFANISFELAKHLPHLAPAVSKPETVKKNNDYSEEFSLLKEVYEDYETEVV